MGCSTFSQYTVVSKYSVVAINPKAPLEKACLLGCGITTGYGAATKSPGIGALPDSSIGAFANTKDWIEGSNVAVFGVGCVGLSILQGCKAKGCARVFAIDTNQSKEEWAKKFGASELLTQPMLWRLVYLWGVSRVC
jgi:S-(hydroxymethyl)glutathione dehydrogenase/alcohol dehydrogenase